MNAIRESVRHEINSAYKAEQREKRRREAEEDGDQLPGEEDEDVVKEDPVPAITRAHFEVTAFCRLLRGLFAYDVFFVLFTICLLLSRALCAMRIHRRSTFFFVQFSSSLYSLLSLF